MVSDSITKCFNDHRYWFYNVRLGTSKDRSYPETIRLYSVKEEILKSDIILILASPGTMNPIGWGFIDEAYEFVNGMIGPIIFDKSKWPGLVSDITGFAQPEEWGTWSCEKKITIKTVFKLPREFTLKLVANAFGPNKNHPFHISIGNNRQEFQLSGLKTVSRIHFSTTGYDSLIAIEIPHPISPQMLGLSDDNRMLGIGLTSLSIIPDDKLFRCTGQIK